MSKPPDLSAFPIPRKEERNQLRTPIGGPRARGGRRIRRPAFGLPKTRGARGDAPPVAQNSVEAAARNRPVLADPRRINPPAPTYGQIVATTVKLDENRYLRLMEAGKPEPGRLKRRSIQDMLIEALDEWFERRRL